MLNALLGVAVSCVTYAWLDVVGNPFAGPLASP
jgi:hypothetical protein